MSKSLENAVQLEAHEILLLTPFQKATNAIIWIKELLATKAKQGNSKLGNAKVGFCCLGVGCTILNIKDYSFVAGTDARFTASVGLITHVGYPHYPDHKDPFLRSLTELNDNEKYTFKQIAVHLCKHHLYYFHKDVSDQIGILLKEENLIQTS